MHDYRAKVTLDAQWGAIGRVRVHPDGGRLRADRQGSLVVRLCLGDGAGRSECERKCQRNNARAVQWRHGSGSLGWFTTMVLPLD